ncbi:MAG: cytochrome c biogenesis protein [Gammaproteobacteria bacterium]|nr:cytochrome c biogenesis protein [Gammaproteobacteria bacterium]
MSTPDTQALRPRTLQASGLALAGLAVAAATLVITAPTDRVQGVVQKILYVHVPCAFAAYLGFAITAIAGVLYLWRNDERFDRVAASAAEVGVLFCTLTILSGPIWAKGTWGHWWAWDPRLTVTLLLWFVYLAYLLLRSFTEGSARTARFAAVYGILGVFAVPFNYFAIDLFGGAAMHPENLNRGSLGAGMGWPFAVAVGTGIGVFVHLLLLRVDVGARRQAAEHAAQQGEFAD